MKSFDSAAVLHSKTEYRCKLARLPIAEKLRLVEAMAERTLLIKRAKKVDPHDVSDVNHHNQ